jgi:hypothetical protein
MYSIAAMVAASVSLAMAAPVRIRVMDPAGAEGLGKILIIIKALDGTGDVLRALSDSKGWIPSVDLSSGTYRVIATFPYGYWFTQVREFEVSDKPVDVEMHMDGGAVNRIPYPGLKLKVTVIDREGKPVGGAEVLGRDPDATVDHWDQTDAHGQAAVTISVDGADVVAFYKGQVISKRIDIPFEEPECPEKDRAIEKLKKTPHSVTLQLP